jgi:hypothetical protein
MSVKTDYANSVRSEIDRYAVWEPGQPLELGDYGELHDRTFQKRGNIREFAVSAEHSKGAPSLYEFTSAGTTVAESDISGSVGVGSGGASPKVSMEFKFSREKGLVIRAAESHTIQISNLQKVAAQLHALRTWQFGWKIVSELRTASNATILMGRSAGSSMKIEASAQALEQFKLGSLKTEAGLAITGEVGYKLVGASGPLLIDLVRVRRLWGGAARNLQIGAGIRDEPYERVATSVNEEDDE